MALKHRLHHVYKITRRIRVWQLLVLLVLTVAAAAYFLRQNNLEMITLRDAVKVADETNKDVKQSLLNLQAYVSNHMNTSLGNGIVLQGTYQRAYDAVLQKALEASNPSSAIYAQVELECRPVFTRTRSFPAYTDCARAKLNSLTPGQDTLSNLQTPPADLFTYNFASPLWSPDAAGFSVLLALFFALLLVARVVGYFVLRAILRAHQ